MNRKRDISDFKLRVTIRQWRWLSDPGAGHYPEEVTNWTVWAKKKNRSGSQFNTEGQQQWQYETTFTIRFNEDFKSNMTVDSGGQRWLINSIEIDNEGYKGFMKLRCSTTDIGLNVS